jgi:hypothetical protein
MNSLIRTVLSLVIVVGSFMAAMRVSNSMLVHDDATIFIKGSCPVALTDGNCVVHGDITHELISGNALITFSDGRILSIQADRIGAVSYLTANSHFEPYGKIFTGVVGFSILILGGVFGLYAPAALSRRRPREGSA